MHRKAFTLIEMIIALSIGMLILAGAIDICLLYLRQIDRCEKRMENMQACMFVLRRIEDDVKQSSAILPQSNADELILHIGNDQIGYSFSNLKIKRSINQYVSYLIEENQLSSLKFSYLPGQVNIEAGMGLKNYNLILYRSDHG